MITEIVTLRLPGILAREDILERFDASARVWADNPDLIRKNYLLDIENGIISGVYLWRPERQRRSGTVRSFVNGRGRCTAPSRTYGSSIRPLSSTTLQVLW